MAVERVKRVWLISPREGSEGVLEKLYSLSAVHLQRADAADEKIAKKVTRLTADAEDVEERISRLKAILSVFDAFHPSKKGFLADMLSLPLEISGQKVREALEQLDEKDLAEKCESLHEQFEANQKRLQEITQDLSAINDFRHLDLRRPEGWPNVTVQLGFVPRSQATPLIDAFEGQKWGAAQTLAAVGSKTLIALAFLAKKSQDAHDIVARTGIEPLVMPPDAPTLADYIKQLHAESEALQHRQKQIREQIKNLAHRRDETIAALANAENELRRIRAIEDVAVTGRMAVLSGYVRERDAAAFDAEVSKLPAIAAMYEDPEPAEPGVPTVLRQRRLLRPAQFLVRMFGVPRYGALDPSPFILITFLIFFGFCFGDVIYGLGLIVLGGLLAHRVRDYPSLKDFFMLLAYAGASSVVVGALTGSWATDLFNYLGPLQKVSESVAVFDILAKPVLALLVAIGIGVINQLYAMVLRIADAVRLRDPMGAVDGILWLMFLPGLVLLLASRMMGLADWLGNLALVLLAVSAVGLVLTQGRHEKGIVAKGITGLVSLYGILGSYGGVTFIGDILSYSRLLALGLTTFIVGISFNIVAGLARDIPLFGIPLFVLIVILGHTFNFFIGILSAFVHSGRLVFVEFFGRFYNSEGTPFKPYGPAEDRVRVIT